MTNGAIDYAATFFRYKTPTPIHGTPTNTTLKRLKTELGANASSVESDLGGGDHGYLGLVLTDEEYARISLNLFVPPYFPGELNIDPDANHIVALISDNHIMKHVVVTMSAKHVEKALQRHIQDAMEAKYLESLINEDTQLIQEDIPTVLRYLFETHGKVPSEKVKQTEQEIKTMSFHPADPMIILYNPIEKLKKLGEAAGIPYTENQFLDVGLTVIRNTLDFERALSDWELLQDNQKTWEHFKLHFKTAQQQLKAIRGHTMQQAGYHHVNHLAAQYKEINQKLLSLIQEAMDTQASASSTKPSTVSELTTPTTTHQVNATTSNAIQLEMLQLLRTMQQDIIQCQPAASATSEPRKRRPRKTPDNATYPRKLTNQYCWTHGACSHPSQTCNAKAQSHQDKATFANKMGGSKAYCE